MTALAKASLKKSHSIVIPLLSTFAESFKLAKEPLLKIRPGEKTIQEGSNNIFSNGMVLRCWESVYQKEGSTTEHSQRVYTF
jgi:hypothetical protein